MKGPKFVKQNGVQLFLFKKKMFFSSFLSFSPKFVSLMALGRTRILCFDGRRQFVVSAPCTNCRRRQFAQGATICGVRFCKVMHRLSPTSACARTTICSATGGRFPTSLLFLFIVQVLRGM